MVAHTSGILPKHLRKSYEFFAIISGILLLSGNILLYRAIRHTEMGNIRMRVRALVQQQLEIAAYSLHQRDTALLAQTSEWLLRQQGVRYLVITDAEHRSFFSKSTFSENEFTLPEEFRRPFCSNENISEHDSRLSGEPILRVDADIRSGKPPSNCVGMLYLGVSLKNAERSLWSLFAISCSFSALLFGGVLTAVIIFSHQTIHVLQGINRSLLALISADSPASQPGGSTPQMMIETTIGRVAAHCAWLRERLHIMTSQCSQAFNDLTTIAEAQMGNGHRHVSLTLQYAQLTGACLKAFSEQASNAEQINETAAATLRSTRALDGNIERFANGLDEMRDSVENNLERVKILNDTIRKIRNAVKTITSIADLTKLIAFNASIEAAGAGKSGGRFSIVATEVRRLANTVVNSVEEIEKLVSSIETAAADLQVSSEIGRHKVAEERTLMFELHGLLQQTEELLQHTSTSAQGLIASMQQSAEDRERLSADMQTLTDEAEQIAYNHLQVLESVKNLDALITRCEEE